MFIGVFYALNFRDIINITVMKFRYDKDREKLIVSEAERLEYNQCQIWLKRHVNGYKYMAPYKMGYWDGQIDYFNDGQINLGLWKELVKAMKEIGSNFILENKEDFPIDRNLTIEDIKEFCDEFFSNHFITKDGVDIKFTPRDYQIDTCFKILKNKFCIASVATSGGKTLIMSIIIFYILNRINEDAKFLIIVPAISLVVQTTDEILSFNTAFKRGHSMELDIRIEEVMSQSPRKFGKENPNIYIGCYQSLEKWPDEFFQQFDCVIVDESHQSKIKSIQSIMERTFGHAQYRFGLSGTFPEDMSCEILAIQSITGPKITDITARKLIDEGSITPMDIKVMYLNHDDQPFDNILKSIRKNPNRGIEAYQAEREYIQKSKKRNEFIKKLVGKCTKNTLVLFNTIDFGKPLYDEFKKEQTDKLFYYIDGSIKSKDRKQIIDDMDLNDGKVRVLIASFGTLSTGISIKNLHNIIFIESFKSANRIIQSIGRSLRLHFDKKTANIFDLVDVFVEKEQRNAFYKHGQERMRLYKEHKYPYKELKFNL